MTILKFAGGDLLLHRKDDRRVWGYLRADGEAVTTFLKLTSPAEAICHDGGRSDFISRGTIFPAHSPDLDVGEEPKPAAGQFLSYRLDH
ncbi:hypothetical protein [Rhizobium sp. P28RR-XV]|uniref:hypothetical protein n=1 Tax=Rhizobium sp. P28RR-XV TaxID=2726737 RepID=UPI001456835D|nr:hypothetical protein [Rhizobium sp. P28RR-XV]NLR88650.1 hypothetical protein [Rhizobium sp. P28RR-XV]